MVGMVRPLFGRGARLGRSASTHCWQRFRIISLLTGSVAKLDYAGAAARLIKAEALGLTLFVEPNGGHAVADALAADSDGYSLPCTLLIDRRGRVRGRATGIPVMRSASLSPGTPPAAGTHPLSGTDKQAMNNGAIRTAWASPDGEAFLIALRGGLLDRV